MQDAQSTTDLSFRFRTSRPEALLVLVAGRTDYCLVMLQAGTIKVRTDDQHTLQLLLINRIQRSKTSANQISNCIKNGKKRDIYLHWMFYHITKLIISSLQRNPLINTLHIVLHYHLFCLCWYNNILDFILINIGQLEICPMRQKIALSNNTSKTLNMVMVTLKWIWLS